MPQPRLKILQLGPQSEPFNQRLAEVFDVSQLWLEPDSPGWLAQHGAGIDAVMTSARFGCGTHLLNALPNLQAICSLGVGYDSIDLTYAQQHSIMVSNTPDVLNDCVADLAFGLMLDVSRRISEADRWVRSGQWNGTPFPMGCSVHHKKLGIVGLGRVGKTVARRAGGFDMAVAYHNRRPDPSTHHIYVESLAELARWADFLLLTCIGGASTAGLISYPILEALGPRGVLINVARGSVVDEQALIKALSGNIIAGAGLDVFENEPVVPAALRAMPNVVLAPHIASATSETRRAMEDLVFDNLQSFQTSGQLITPIARLS